MAREIRDVATATSPTHRHLRERVFVLVTLTAAVDVVGTALVWLFEDGRGGIDNPWDAFFWTSTQLLTISSQLPNPVSVGGRVVDLVLQVFAISVVASLAGSFAAFFHRRGLERDPME